MDRILTLEFVRVTEAAAIKCGRLVGRGDKIGADQLAVDSVDIAVDPLEGTNLVAKGQNGAIAVLSIAPRGCLLHAPDMYMEKIAVGPRAAGRIDINAPVKENLRRVAEAMERSVDDLSVVILDRERPFDHGLRCHAGDRSRH